MSAKSWEDPRVHAGMTAQLRLRRERIDAGDAAKSGLAMNGSSNKKAMQEMILLMPILWAR